MTPQSAIHSKDDRHTRTVSDRPVSVQSRKPWRPSVRPGRRSGPEERASRVYARDLLTELHTTKPTAQRRNDLRDQLVRLHMPLVHHVVRRIAHRSDQLADVVQVGALGLVNAIDRFDPTRGIEFSTYAVPTISGEIKRYFRDTGWLLHVPRTAQELQTRIDAARHLLSQQLGLDPDAAQIAAQIDEPVARVAEAVDVARTRHGVALDTLASPEDGPERMPAALCVTDGGFDRAENRALLRPALEALSPQERRVLMLRFVADRTQVEIARSIGVSQMQVSRLITRALGKLREHLVTAGYPNRYGSAPRSAA